MYRHSLRAILRVGASVAARAGAEPARAGPSESLARRRPRRSLARRNRLVPVSHRGTAKGSLARRQFLPVRCAHTLVSVATGSSHGNRLVATGSSQCLTATGSLARRRRVSRQRRRVAERGSIICKFGGSVIRGNEPVSNLSSE